MWFGDKRELQTAADAAAISGGYQLLAGQTTAAIAGTAMATKLGFTGTATCGTGVAGNTICIRTPPLTGPFAGNANAVEAILTAPQVSLCPVRFLPAGLTVTARATGDGHFVPKSMRPCTVTNSSGISNITFQSGTTVIMPNCILASKILNMDNSIDLLSDTTLNAYTVYSIGGMLPAGSTTFSSAQIPITFGPKSVGDPTPSSAQR